jgi:hypothetical protein
VFGEKVNGGNPKRLCDGIQSRKRNVPLAALDCANVGAVETALLGTGFLRPVSVEA